MPNLRSYGLVALYLGAQLVALVLALPFKAQGLSTNANPTSPSSPLYLILLIIAAPVGILLVAKLRGGLATLRWVILIGIAVSLTYTLSAAFQALVPSWAWLPPDAAGISFVPSTLLGPLAAILLFEALVLEPQWYVVDLVGFVAAGSLIALFGISFAILPTVLLLLALAVYDAVAVYGTKHMVSLAEVVTDLKLPILMVMPGHADYDYTRSPKFGQERKRPVAEREATFMGLGDVVFPGILPVSAYVWLPTAPHLLGVGANVWVAVGALLGGLAGYALLMRFVQRGNPQAGLPFLNGGVLAGYLVAYLLLVHSLSLGFSFAF